MRVLNFSDGFSSNSEPNLGTISVNNLFVFSTDEEFVEYKGLPATQGDIYFNSTGGFVRYFDGMGWQIFSNIDDLAGLETFLQNQINDRATIGSLSSHSLANTGVHGVSGDIVGTTDAQTLTNKTLSEPVINSPSGLSKVDVGLSNVDNTSDANKPISTATQTALNEKANSSTVTAHTGASTSVHGITGAVVGTTDTQNISNKTLTNADIDGGMASNASRITLPKNTKTNLDALARKQGTIVFDTVSNKPYYDDGVSLQLIGADASANAAIESLLLKKDSLSPCFTKTGAQSLSIKAGTRMVVDNTFVLFSVDTAVVMPTLTTGTDYAIYICKDGTVRADANFTAPTGYTTTNSKQAGGFHYGAVSPTETVAGGAFATTGNGMIWTQSDVDKLKGINQFSIWDLKFRPACSDPRGMALVANRFWVDIYFCNTNPEVNGTSKYNSDVASGTVLPKKPTMFGGNGTATYANLNGWTANELARAFGKRFMKESEFVVAAFGVTEDQSLGGAASTITNAIRQAGYTSKWGLEQATGHHWTWGEDTSIRPTYAADAWGWQDVNGDRGQRYLINSLGESRILLGGDRGSAANSGSRAASWYNYPWHSYWAIGLRAACDHLQLV